MDALDEEMQRVRATRRRLERDQQAAETIASDAQGMNERPGNKKRFPILAIFAVVGPVLLILIILYAMLVQ
jgi:hypothetical protein